MNIDSYLIKNEVQKENLKNYHLVRNTRNIHIQFVRGLSNTLWILINIRLLILDLDITEPTIIKIIINKYLKILNS